MKYRVAFRNGMVVIIEADTIGAASHAGINFANEGKPDSESYVSASDVLFVAPEGRSHVEHQAVNPMTTSK